MKIKNKIMQRYYSNLLEDGQLFLIKNKKKSGVYCIMNNLNNKIYVGSAVDLTERFYRYLNPNSLKRIISKGSGSYIYKALLKYGYANFSVNILEYSTKSEVLKLEQYYIDLLNPEYNILKNAGSSLGYKHSPETLAKLKVISKDSSYINKLKLTQSSLRGHTTILINKLDNSIQKYDSITEAAKSLKVDNATLRYYLKSGKLYKDTYLMLRLINIPPLELEFSTLDLEKPEEVKNEPVNSIKIKSSYVIKVQNLLTNETITFYSIRKAANSINKHHSYIAKCLIKKEFYRNDNYFVFRELI